jgi:hypothetical protein
MIEIAGDLWIEAQDADALCITTNGTISISGRGVMGRGVARQAKERYPTIEVTLGELLRVRGNVVQLLLEDPTLCPLYAFPVKHNWWETADLELIHRSACQLVGETTVRNFRRVLLPRAGCGNGKLLWSEVRSILEPILDDRFVIVERDL